MQTNKSNGQMTAQINLGDHKKSGFDLSNNVLGTGKIGRIIPTRALHVMPNDTIKADSKVAVQFEPLAVPILANMDVKQEHFYVPYNIVWKDWDKFISGGEKLDFKGVVPNVSMRSMYDAIISVFGQNQASLFTLDLKKDTGGVFLNVRTIADDINAYKEGLTNSIDTIGDTYFIKDLLKPLYEAVNLFTQKVQDDALGQSSNIKIFGLVPTQEVKNYVEYTLNNKYLITIQDALAAYNATVAVPTAEGMEYLAIMYEYYKPFIGIGSNIDYLNMGRLTFTDFVYAMSLTATDVFVKSNTSTQYPLRIDSVHLSDLPMSILNLRANYNIWFNNYRDILLEADAFEPNDTGVISTTEIFCLLVPRQRCWEKDAFTTALDNPGTGSVGVSTTSVMDAIGAGYNSYLQDVPERSADNNDVYQVEIDGESWRVPTAYLTGINPQNESPETIDGSGFSLYQLDAAQRAQKWLQKALFYGNRISDFYYMHFGVRFLDARLRLPELLTSSSELVKLDVVMNNTNITTEANGEIYQSIAGDRAAYASAYDNGNSFERFCEEHGVIMSYLTIMPQVTYAYGMNRDYSRLDQFDFAFSEFATLGMDAVYDSEITSISVNLPNNEQDVQVFGYQGKYYDYKAKHSEEHGELLDSQDMYTFARKFNMYDPNGRPKLNYEFVHCFPDLDMFVVDSTLNDYFRYDIRHSTAAERNLPSQSIYI